MEHGNPRNLKTGKKSLSPILLWAVFASLPSSWTNDSRLQQQWIAMCLSWNRERSWQYVWKCALFTNPYWSPSRLLLLRSHKLDHSNMSVDVELHWQSYEREDNKFNFITAGRRRRRPTANQQLIWIKQFFNLQSGLFVRALDCEPDQKNMLKTSTVRRELCAKVVKSALALA